MANLLQTSQAPVAQAKKGAASGTGIVPFSRAGKWHIEQGTVYSLITINAAQPGTFFFDVPTYGFLSALRFTFSTQSGTGAAAVYYEDAPWSIIQSITVFDVNGTPIIGPISGYEAFLQMVAGGYRLFRLDKAVQSDVATANIYSTPTTGNFFFQLVLYHEFGRNGLGCLPNMDASAKYRVQIILNSGTASATGPVFTTAPTTYPTMNIQLEGLYRGLPLAVDQFGNQNSVAPPAVGTVQYWSKQTASPINGAQTLQLTRVGNVIRNQILVFRDNVTGTRLQAETADLPTTAPFEYDWDSSQRYIANFATLRALHIEESNYLPPMGVLILHNTDDPDKLALSEYGDSWMPTTGATKLVLRFTPQNAVQLTVLTNDIVMASSAAYGAPKLELS